VGGYFAIFFASFYVNFRLHPAGVGLWILASLPVLPILAVLVLMGRYLRDERDEFKRDMVVRCLLWGMTGYFAVNMLADYLHIYGWKGMFPPFTGFWVFFVFMFAAKMSYRARNRAPVEE
jgi:hypothetical protein